MLAPRVINAGKRVERPATPPGGDAEGGAVALHLTPCHRGISRFATSADAAGGSCRFK
jgi:hypothetical protein